MSSLIWLQKHFQDQYVRIAQKEGLRSRSWFKLDEINQVDTLFHSGMMVLDLGSSPGGWSLYVKSKVGDIGNIIACDMLPMQKIYGVNFVQGDCASSNILEKLRMWIKNRKVQVVLSDMSPNVTGISIIDISRSIYLGNLALDICRYFLCSGGTFLVKVFQGAGFDEYLNNLRYLFHTVKIRKPDASRLRSREVYIVAKKYKKL